MSDSEIRKARKEYYRKLDSAYDKTTTPRFDGMMNNCCTALRN